MAYIIECVPYLLCGFALTVMLSIHCMFSLVCDVRWIDVSIGTFITSTSIGSKTRPGELHVLVISNSESVAFLILFFNKVFQGEDLI